VTFLLSQQSRHDQMALELPVSCKEPGCTEPVVGSSITGKGHVCKVHNTREWGAALGRSRDPHYRAVGAALVADSRLVSP
jgi:hypothetical protein